jgi:hypothetical protein
MSRSRIARVTRSVIIVGLGSVLGASVRVSGQPLQKPAVGSGLIVGQVIDAGTRRPIAGAIVAMTGPGIQPPRILTGGDGRFVFRDLPRGTFTISATRSGFADGVSGRRRPAGPSQPVTLDDGERVGDVAVRMWKFGAITGTVIDETGEPIVGAQIRAFRRDMVGGRRRFVSLPPAITDDRGVYRLGNLLPGEYSVGAVARPVAVPLAFAQEAGNRIPPAPAEIGGTPPLPGTSMGVQVGDVGYSIGRGLAIPPPPSGDRLLVYPPTLYPSATSLAQATVIALTSGEERSAIDLQMRPAPTVHVSGTVVGPEGVAPAMTVRLLPAGPDEGALELDAMTAVTDRNGIFTFPAVPAGEYSLRAVSRPRAPVATDRVDRALWADLPLTIGRTDIVGLTVTLQPGLRISGRFEFEGATGRPTASGLQQVPLAIESADGMGAVPIPTPPSRVDDAGQFTTVGLGPGRYFVRVAGSPKGWMFKTATYNGRDVADAPLDLQGGDANGVVITFTDRWTGMRGVVQAPRGGPDADAVVLVFPTDAHGWASYGTNVRRVRSVRTSRTGEYSLHSLPIGDYYVIALPDEQAVDWQDPKFLEGLVLGARRVTIGDGDQPVQDLRTREVR